MKNKYINPRFPHMIHGGDYNPEQWLHDKSIWDKDMELMTKANINELTVGIFSWAVLEPREGEFDFSFLDEIIDKIYANGGRVVLATPSGARPHWMADKYPEVLRVNKNLDRDHFRGRHNHCYTSPVYREKVRIINTKLAERYAGHPGVVMWHISNEYNTGDCHCEYCKENFRKYLNAMFDEVVSCELDENYMPIIDNTKISSVSSASLKVAIRLAYVLALLNESIDSKIESSHLGILLLDSPKDKDLDNYRFDKYLQTIDNECCGQIIITGSLSDEDLYKSNLKKATYFEALRTTSKLLKKM